MADGAELYAHDPVTLVPLLEAHLPYSLPIYGALKTNNWARMEDTTSIPSLPSGKADISDKQLYGSIWATFPPASIPPMDTTAGAETWAVLLHLPAPQTSQTRLYCSAERALTTTGPSSASATATSVQSLGRSGSGGGPRHRMWRKGQDTTNGLIRTIKECSPVVVKFGAINSLWTEEISAFLGKPGGDIYEIWLAPEGEDVKLKSVDKTGLVVDGCTEEDCEMVSVCYSHLPLRLRLSYHEMVLIIDLLDPCNQGRPSILHPTAKSHHGTTSKRREGSILDHDPRSGRPGSSLHSPRIQTAGTGKMGHCGEPATRRREG